MPNSTRYEAIIDLDVTNAEDDSAARQAIFNMLSNAAPQTKSGRPTSGAKAAITGIKIFDKETEQEVFKTELHKPYIRTSEYPGLPESSKADVLD